MEQKEATVGQKSNIAYEKLNIHVLHIGTNMLEDI